MTVLELKRELEGYDDDTEVLVLDVVNNFYNEVCKVLYEPKEGEEPEAVVISI